MSNSMVYYPLDEITTALLPVTFGCAYNKCAFCSMYKGEEYGEASLHDIEMHLLNMYKYTEKIFLTGADPISIGFDKMKNLLSIIHQYLPYCACIASYASIRSISKYSVEELSILHDMGLRLLYVGFETGSDEALKLMKKGHTVDNAIEQANKLNKANIPFNSIIMYGIAGKGKSLDNAAATAKMINKFVTNKIITMNLTVFNGTELNKMIKCGEYVVSDIKERLLEIRELIENLKPRNQMLFDTTHPTNIIKIKGTLPQDKEKLINGIARL